MRPLDDGPDNIVVSPRGKIIVCEEGYEDPNSLKVLDPVGWAHVKAEPAPGPAQGLEPDARYPIDRRAHAACHRCAACNDEVAVRNDRRK